MNCKMTQRAIGERLPDSTATLPDSLLVHLAGCSTCQIYAEEMGVVSNAFARWRALTASLPEKDIVAARGRIQAVATSRWNDFGQRGWVASPLFSDPLLVWGLGLAAAAFIAFIGIFAWPDSLRSRQECDSVVLPGNVPAMSHSESLPSAFPKSHEVLVGLSHDVSLSHTVSPVRPGLTVASEGECLVGLPAFEEEFEALKAANKGIGLGFLQRFARYLKDPARTIDERLEGWKLLSEACEEAGEKKRAVESFGCHLDAYEEYRIAQNSGRRGLKLPLASDYALTKVTRVFYGDKDKFGALAYGDLILTRYPDSPEADRVQMLIGEYYESIRNYEAGIRQMRVIMELCVDTLLVRRAKENLERMIYNAQRKDEALAT